jgi:hypothetical protein
MTNVPGRLAVIAGGWPDLCKILESLAQDVNAFRLSPDSRRKLT